MSDLITLMKNTFSTIKNKIIFQRYSVVEESLICRETQSTDINVLLE